MYAQNSILCQFGNLEICPNFANPYLTQFSSISGGNCIIEHQCAWEITYLHGISRAAQDTAHLHLCLMNSLTQAGKDKVRLWSDDSGKIHTFEIPNSYYVPSCELRLLSPQHWAQTRNPVDRETTRCITSSVNVYLRWTNGDENYELTLPLNKRGSNVGTLYSHPGQNKYDLFCQAAAITIADDKDPIALPANVISDDKDNEERNTEPQIGPPPITIPKTRHGNQGITSEQTTEDNPRELHLSPEQKGITTADLPAIIEEDNTSIIIDFIDRKVLWRQSY